MSFGVAIQDLFMQPLTTKVLDRCGGARLHAGAASIHGGRAAMEDAHLMLAAPHGGAEWGAFGVFDGHCGDDCAGFVQGRFRDTLAAAAAPADDAGLAALSLRIDAEFLARHPPGAVTSGTTAALAIVRAPDGYGGEYTVRAFNVGDSRVLVGDAAGRGRCLTRDHKPDLPAERARIEAAGSQVTPGPGVPRVNGDLAMSRAFGDAHHKVAKGRPPEEQAVCAVPDVTVAACAAGGFVVAACDGVFEGASADAGLSDDAVIDVVAAELSGGATPAAAAGRVCDEALRRGSSDNITCVIGVLAPPPAECDADARCVPGPYAAPWNPTFRRAYEAMAKRGGLSLAAALGRRYGIVQERVRALEAEKTYGTRSLLHDTPCGPAELRALHAELGRMAALPSGDGADGGAAPAAGLDALDDAGRERWFEGYAQRVERLSSSAPASAHCSLGHATPRAGCAECASGARAEAAHAAKRPRTADPELSREYDAKRAEYQAWRVQFKVKHGRLPKAADLKDPQYAEQAALYQRLVELKGAVQPG